MKNRLFYLLFLVSSVLSLGVLGALSISCEPLVTLEFENQTEQSLIIYVNDLRIDNILPGHTIKRRTVPLMDSEFLIEAKNKVGETLYFKKFVYKELHDVDFKVVIPTSFE